MSRRTGLFLLVAAAGFFLYLWPALRAPVVVWSDSTLDMEWARRGVGIVSPIPPPGPGEEPPRHPAKPAYLLFLRLVQKFGPSGQEQRTIVVAQSLFLWLSVVGTSLLVLRRRGAAGVAFLAALLFFLRTRALLDANARRSIELELSSFGSYGEQQYLLFPVIPPLWRKGARRDGSAQLSPSTGIPSGSLDWWTHAGVE